MFILNNRNIRKMCEIWSKLTVNDVVLVFLLLTLNRFYVFASVSVVDFEQVNIRLAGYWPYLTIKICNITCEKYTKFCAKNLIYQEELLAFQEYFAVHSFLQLPEVDGILDHFPYLVLACSPKPILRGQMWFFKNDNYGNF